MLPGDFFGLLFGDRSDATIEAVQENTVVASYPRPRIELLAESDSKIARELRQIAEFAGQRVSLTGVLDGQTIKVSSATLQAEERRGGQ